MVRWGRQIRVEFQEIGVTIEKPRIDIDVQVAADSDPNFAEVSVFGLAPSTYNLIEERGDSIEISAGYSTLGGARTIFKGVIQRVDRSRRENAFVTIVKASDSLRSNKVKGGEISQTFKGEASAREIAKTLVGAMSPIELGDLSAIPSGAVVKDFRADGKPAEQVDRLLDQIPDANVRWYIDEVGVARFDRGFEPRSDAPSIELSPPPDGSMVGTPNQEEDRRLSVSCMIDPRVKLGSGLIIRGSDYVDPGQYKVVGINSAGTNWQGSFISQLDALPIDYEVKDE